MYSFSMHNRHMDANSSVGADGLGVRTPTRLRTVADWFVISDPGWGRAQMGWRTLVSFVAGMAAGYGAAKGLGLPQFLGIVFGGVIGFISGLQVPDGPLRVVAGDISWFVPPFAAGLLLSIGLAPHRAAGLSLIVVIVFVGACLDRFGHRGHFFGTMVFAVYLLGLSAPVPLSLYLRSLVVAIAAVAGCILVRFALCWYSPVRDLRQTRRAWQATCRRLAASAQGIVLGSEPAARRWRRNLDRVNTMALVLDGRLAHKSLDGYLAEHLHRTVFDVEQALASLIALCQELAEERAPTAQAAAAAQMAALAAGQPGDAAALRACAAELRAEPAPQVRACELLDLVADELDTYRLSTRTASDELALAAAEHVGFAGVVALEGARPAGARSLARKAAAAAPAIWWGRVRRPAPVTVTAIQVAIATAIALPVGYAFDPQHYYWAVIGVLIMVAPTSTPHERGRKVLRRIAGTVVGAVAGIAIHHLVGLSRPWWTLTVIVLALTIGAYFITVSYPLFVTGLVIALVQLYALDTSSGNLDTLLVHRLAENLLGGVIAVIVTLVVLPVSTRAVVRAGLHASLGALNAFIASLGVYLIDPHAGIRLRSDARAFDHALFQTRQVSAHLVRTPARRAVRRVDRTSVEQRRGLATRWGGRYQRLDVVTDGLSAAALEVRTIARYAPHLPSRDGAVATGITRILDTLSTSITAFDGCIDGLDDQEWTSCGPLIRQLRTELPDDAADLDRSLAALEGIDSRLTGFAPGFGMIVIDPTAEPSVPSIG
jgi:uncharacterized membrane protein YccC